MIIDARRRTAVHAVFAAASLLAALTSVHAPRAQEPDGSSPRLSYDRDVSPIVRARCVSCHREGGPAPFPLSSYDDVASRARLVASVIETGYMPPWLPAEGSETFEGARRLSAPERHTLLQWVAQRAPRGDEDPSASGPAADETAAQGSIGTRHPDLRVTTDEGYVLPAEGPDLFRSFVLRVPLDRGRYVSAVSIDPGPSRAVHHVTLGVDGTRTARRLDAMDSMPGFEGMMTGAAQSPPGHFIGWAPGKGLQVSPRGLSWRFNAGADIVLQVHMVPSGKPELVRPAVSMWFTDDAPTHRALLVRGGNTRIDIPPGASAYVTEDTFELPVEVEVRAVSPHAHYRTTRIEAVARPPDGGSRPLLTIPSWDFRWQDDYRFKAPPRLPAGTRIVTRVTFDNSDRNLVNPHLPPQRGVYGPSASDEMADVWLQVVPRTAGDAATLARALAAREIEAQTAGYRTLVSAKPEDPSSRLALATLHLHAGRVQDAIGELDRILSTAPDMAVALYTRGVAFERLGVLRDAARDLHAALARDPLYAEAEHALGHVRLKQRNPQEAERHFARAVELWPEFADGWNSLGTLRASSGAIDGAIAAFRRVLIATPEHREALNNLGILLARQNRIAEAIVVLERAVAAHPDDAVSRQNLAAAVALRP